MITHLDYGLRADGGIGEHIQAHSYDIDRGYYLGRFLYNLIYFVVVYIIEFSILMGIIIDTFSELREQSSKKEEDMARLCFICGESRENLEKRSKDFLHHINKDHNIWTYAEYIIGLKFLNPQDVNATNSYVMGTVNIKGISWFPHSDGKMREAEESEENEEEN